MYAKENHIDKEPEFAWWVPSSLKHIKMIIIKKATIVRKKMKFGISIPASYDEVVEIDRINGNTYWQDATKKEMKNVNVAFKSLDNRIKLPIGFNNITCHLIFDVKFGLTRKSRYIGSGHLTQVPASVSCSRNVSRDSVRIMFLIAAFNYLDIKMYDIGNA